MEQRNVACPACGAPVRAETEVELIRVFQDHAKRYHQMDWTAEKILDLEKTQMKK